MKKLLVIGLCSILTVAAFLFAVVSYNAHKQRQFDSNQVALASAIAKHDAINAAALAQEQSKGASQATTIKTLCDVLIANKVKGVSNPTLCQ